MNLEISNTPNFFETGAVGNLSTFSFKYEETNGLETSSADYETYGQSVLDEISRIKKVSLEEAKRFVDLSSFDQIVRCLRDGLSSMGDLDPGILAMTFCHISTS